MNGEAWPEGLITILFTDIESSSAMASSVGDDVYREALREPHNRLIREAAAAAGGWEVGTPAGDSLMLVFHRAGDAVRCSRAIQEGLKASPLRAVSPQGREWQVRVRIGIHTAEVPLRRTVDGEYVGADVSYAKRIESLGAGGQVLASSSAWRACHEESGVDWERWPNRHLRGFGGLVTIYELLWSGVSLGEPGAAGRPAHEQARALFEAGRWAEAWDSMQVVQTLAIQHGDRRGEVMASANLGAVGIHLGRMVEADAHLEVALEGARQLGDRVMEARVLGNQAISASSQGRLEAAERFYRKALRLAEELREWSDVVGLLRGLAQLHREQGDQARAGRDLAAAREAAARQGLACEEARTLQALALLAIDQGRSDDAEQHLGEALEIAVPQGDRHLEGQVLNNLGVLAHLAGQPSRAERYYRTSAEILQEARNPVEAARALLNLGALLYEQGELETARHLLSRSREILRERGDIPGAAAALANLALVAREGDLDEREVGRALARAAADRLESAGDEAGAARVLDWLDEWEEA